MIRLLIAVFVILVACKQGKKDPVPDPVIIEEMDAEKDGVQTEPLPEPVTIIPLDQLEDSTFVRLADYSDDFSYDLRYATTDNFLKSQVYECGECYTRARTAKALIQANKDFMKEGVRIRFFDCYRPHDVQFRMWEIVPNPQYVADPEKGSIHNRGGAVDITLETLEGDPLDMGTDFDFFGRKAYHDNLDLPEEVLRNRALLKNIMADHGFASIRTEWWHYNLGGATAYPVANFRWDCPGG